MGPGLKGGVKKNEGSRRNMISFRLSEREGGLFGPRENRRSGEHPGRVTIA